MANPFGADTTLDTSGLPPPPPPTPLQGLTGSLGLVPCSPFDANHLAYSGPVNGSIGSTGSSCLGKRKRSSVPAPQM